MGDNGARANRDEVLAELRSADKLVVVSHENPDGDALGSLIAMQEILAAQGRDSLMFIDSSEFPLPQEYRWFVLSGLVSSPPDDLEQRTIVFLDCGNLERNPAEAFRQAGGTSYTSSTSTTTTTTRCSARSTTCCRRPHARPRSSGT